MERDKHRDTAEIFIGDTAEDGRNAAAIVPDPFAPAGADRRDTPVRYPTGNYRGLGGRVVSGGAGIGKGGWISGRTGTGAGAPVGHESLTSAESAASTGASPVGHGSLTSTESGTSTGAGPAGGHNGLTSAESAAGTGASPVGHGSLTSTESTTSPAARPSGLIAGVQVLEWPQRYNYYQRFCSDAERFFAVRGTECPAEGYFSYIPQYAQLNHAQLRYYLWFRENARAETYLDDVDLPYILLYVYEIINLPHRIPAEKGADQLAGLWLHYRLRRPELDRYLPEWMCDYCLTRDVPLPARLHPIVPEILPRATLKEFYISAVGGDGLSPESVIMAASDYSHRASKYYAEHKEAYDRHIPAAVGRALKACGIAPDPAAMKKVRVERDAFCGSLCAQTVKRRIVVEYYSLARSYRLRQAVTAAVKLAENYVRRAEKIRSRLNTQGTDPALAEAVASYFDAELPPMRKKPEKAVEDTSYERLYDAPTEGIDFALARELENESWAAVPPSDLISPKEEDEPPAVPESNHVSFSAETGPQCPTGEAVEETDETEAVPAEDAVPFGDALRAILAGGTLTAWCKSRPGRVIPAEAAGAINDYAADVLGDVVLEESGGEFILIEDYREDVLSWLTEE